MGLLFSSIKSLSDNFHTAFDFGGSLDAGVPRKGHDAQRNASPK